MRVPISIIDRHVHLSQIDAEKLFWAWYIFHIKKDLLQSQEKLCEENLILKWANWEIKNINVILPFKKISKVEVFGLDKEILWKQSNDSYTYCWTLIGPKWSVYLNEWIHIFQPHIHMSVAQSKDFGFKNNQIVSVKTHWKEIWLLGNVKIRIKDYFEFDFHIDRELANQAWIQKWDWGEIIVREN